MKYVIQWFSWFTLLCHHNHCLIPVLNLISSAYKEILYPFDTQLPFLPTLIPWKPLIFPSPCICVFWTINVNRIIQYVAFCVCFHWLALMFSKFLCFVAYVNTYSFLWMSSIPLCEYTTFGIHHLMDISVVFTFWLYV